MPLEQDEISQQFEQHVTALVNSFTQALQMKLMYGARSMQGQTAQMNAQAQAAQEQAKAKDAVARANEQLNELSLPKAESDKPADPDGDDPDLPPGDVMDANTAAPPRTVVVDANPAYTTTLSPEVAQGMLIAAQVPMSIREGQIMPTQLNSAAQQLALANGMQPVAVLKQAKQLASDAGVAADSQLMGMFDALIGWQSGADAAHIAGDQMGKSATAMTADAATNGLSQAPAPIQAPTPQPGLGM